MSINIDLGRLKRALALEVKEVSNKLQYRVQGSQEDYYVRIGSTPLCYCLDATYRNAYCKHLLAASLATNDPNVMQAALATSNSEYVLRFTRRSIARDTEFPEGMSLTELLGILELSPNDQQLAGRILTDPNAEVRHWRKLAQISPFVEIQHALTRIKDAASDRGVRRILIEKHGEDAWLLLGLLPFAERDELAKIIHALIAAEREMLLIGILEEDKHDVLSRIEPEILSSLLGSKNAEIRERTIRLLAKLSGAQVPSAPVQNHATDDPKACRGPSRL